MMSDISTHDYKAPPSSDTVYEGQPITRSCLKGETATMSSFRWRIKGAHIDDFE